jgi:uncharacterized protein YbjT (DUF2867 family)
MPCRWTLPVADVLLVGATGMVGEAVQAAAAAAQLPVTILVRRPSTSMLPRSGEIIAPADDWPDRVAALCPAILVNCLGTTIAQAGSQAAFRAVDHDLVLAVAQAAKGAGTRHVLSVSSVGASPAARNFYLRTKGQVEQALRQFGFDRLDIVRPGLLMGDRNGPSRPGEAWAMRAAPLTDALLHGSLRRYRSIPAQSVARAIIALARAGGSGAHVHEHDAIRALAAAE